MRPCDPKTARWAQAPGRLSTHGPSILPWPNGSRASPRISEPRRPPRPGRPVVAPAGSGKTTTLVARVAWLVATGGAGLRDPRHHLQQACGGGARERLDAALAPLGIEAGAVRVRTFHALGREILRDAGVATEPLVDRAAILATGGPLGRRRRADASSTGSSPA